MVRKISLFDLPGSKVGLRDAEAASQKFETPLLFCHFQRLMKISALQMSDFDVGRSPHSYNSCDKNGGFSVAISCFGKNWI